jgi:hypothetical protein
MAPNPRDQKWCSIAEQASKETDLAKLQTLVTQLCTALNERMKPYAGEGPTDGYAASNSSAISLVSPMQSLPTILASARL